MNDVSVAFSNIKVCVVIPHYNYAEFIGEALLSVQAQTHRQFECIVVDDFSNPDEYDRAAQHVHVLGDSRFRIVRNEQNLGMIPTVYRGIDQTDALFCCALDPDDRYLPTFLEQMLRVHLNDVTYAPLACCDQLLEKLGRGPVTGTMYTDGAQRTRNGEMEIEESNYLKTGYHRFIEPTERGWPWTTTSSMMFRTDAAMLVKPHRCLTYKGSFDAYIAAGTHMMGGSLLLRRSLVRRGIHSRNDFLGETVISTFHRQWKRDATFWFEVARRDVVEAFLQNGGLRLFSRDDFRDLILAQFQGRDLGDLLLQVPAVTELLASPKSKVVAAEAGG